jgi:20S proteasome alpha/beta subunit
MIRDAEHAFYLPATRIRERIRVRLEPFFAAGFLKRSARHSAEIFAKEEEKNVAARQSKTTVIGLKGGRKEKKKDKRFVLVGGDRRVMWGQYILSHDEIKVTKITPHSVVAAAGTTGIIQLIEDTLKHEIDEFEDVYGDELEENENEKELPVPSQAKLLRFIIREFTPLFTNTWDLSSIFIFGGYDARPNIPPEKRQVLVWYDEVAGRSDDPYIALGSGMEAALDRMRDTEHGWKPGMSEKDAIKLAIRAIWASGKSDPGTGDVEIKEPILVIIDANGMRQVPPPYIRSIINKISKKKPKWERETDL